MRWRAATTGRRWAAAFGLWALAAGCGQHEGPGTIEGRRLPESLLAERASTQGASAEALAARTGAAPPDKQILFGDLHVHTTFSADAFAMSLPIMQGEGAHPVADACDYARYCSAVDFWSINDHAEGLTPRRWSETVDSIRQCNALAGDAELPDVVAFLGWEWTQIGDTPEDHYGHKNVVLRDLEKGRIPTRPIHSDSFATRAMRQPMPLGMRVMLPFLDWEHRQTYWNLVEFMNELRETPLCPAGVDVRELPDDCSEGAGTPQLLFEKLDQWGHAAMVIPHGTTWGIYTPPGSSWDKQLSAAQHDPERQRLIEVFSGHGNSEEYRDWRSVAYDESGEPVCPEPSDGYEPCCWRAGEIIRSRCEDPESEACAERVHQARAHYLAAGVRGRLTVPGQQLTDWGNCGSCPDCFLPSFNYEPASSVQYVMALAKDAPGEPGVFDFGFIASSDNHSARPGTGYKEFGRIPNTEARGPRDATWYRRANPFSEEQPAPESRPFDTAGERVQNLQILDFERQASFFLTGGLVAVHSEGRSRQALWDALWRREVYGTSGPRILLWFDLLNGPDGEVPMGGTARLGEAPRFRVRAAGGFRQLPGCPDPVRGGLSSERLQRLCGGECYHPSDERLAITRIEVVRIRPGTRADEPMSERIEDPWRSFPCPSDPEGCTVEFDDPDFAAGGREVVYYVRAVQEPTQAVNAAELRCTYDGEGRCLEIDPCYGDYRTPRSDDCLATNEERAWSSPIRVSVR